MPASTIGYTWNTAAGRFIAPSGQFVSVEEVRRALDRALHEAALKGKTIASDLVNGSVSLLDFERLMRTLIKDTQIYAAAVAAGGYSQLQVSHLSELSARIAEQFAYLSEWTTEIAKKESEVSDEIVFEQTERAMSARAAMYAQSARRTFEALWKTDQEARGFDEERNVLGHAEHCAMCVDMTSVGWVRIGTLVPIGERTCLTNCRCRIEYRRSAAALRAA